MNTASATLPKSLAMIALCWSSLLPVQAQAQESKIAWISSERIYNESRLAKLASAKLAEEFRTREKAMQELAARFTQLTQRDAEIAVKTILDAVSDALVRGHRIEIRGFGSFSVTRRPPRMGRNPRSGEAVAIPEKRVPHFKPGKALREAVDQRESAQAALKSNP